MIPMQDVIGLKEAGQINDPTNPQGDNWTWKLKDFKVFPSELEKIRGWLETAGRIPGFEAQPVTVVEEDTEDDED